MACSLEKGRQRVLGSLQRRGVGLVGDKSTRLAAAPVSAHQRRLGDSSRRGLGDRSGESSTSILAPLDRAPPRFLSCSTFLSPQPFLTDFSTAFFLGEDFSNNVILFARDCQRVLKKTRREERKKFDPARRRSVWRELHAARRRARLLLRAAPAFEP